MYTLYARNGAGSLAVEALLAACGADYKVIVLNRKPDGSFEDFFLAINPKAEVPTLVLPDGSVMTESAAMMIHICEQHPAAGLAPAPGAPGRAQFLRWQVYLAAALYGSDLRLFYQHRYTTDAAGAEGAVQGGCRHGGFEAQRADRWRCERDSEEDVRVLESCAADRAVCGCDDGGVCVEAHA